VLECTCPEDIIEKRLQSRQSGGGDVSDGRWEIFQAQKGNYERIDEIPEERHLAVDTSLAAEENAFRVLKKMFGLG
jgi:predicted kinase